MASDPSLQPFARVMTEHGWDQGFYQQHCADAYQAEFAGPGTAAITLGFALAGLYLKVERGFDGRAVQSAHAQLARHKDRLPAFAPKPAPIAFGLAQAAKSPSSASVDAWCAAVWESYWEQHPAVRSWVDEHVR